MMTQQIIWWKWWFGAIFGGGDGGAGGEKVPIPSWKVRLPTARKILEIRFFGTCLVVLTDTIYEVRR